MASPKLERENITSTLCGETAIKALFSSSPHMWMITAYRRRTTAESEESHVSSAVVVLSALWRLKETISGKEEGSGLNGHLLPHRLFLSYVCT